MLSPVKHPTAAEAATNVLFEAICNGSIAPGTHLRLQELADQLQLSVMPIREAIRQLAAMELVDLEPHKGARVRPLSLKDLRDTYETRFVLEGSAVRASSRAFTAEAEQAAREALEARARHLQSGEHKLARDAHEKFHFAIYAACGNDWLLRSILPPWRNSERYRLESFRHPELASRRAVEHDEILEATIAREGELAERKLIQHLRWSMDLVAENLERGGETAGSGRVPGVSGGLDSPGGRRRAVTGGDLDVRT